MHSGRECGDLDRRLADRFHIAGDYSTADIACYPWIRMHEHQGQNLADFQHLARWFDDLSARPAVVRLYEIAAEINTVPR